MALATAQLPIGALVFRPARLGVADARPLFCGLREGNFLVARLCHDKGLSESIHESDERKMLRHLGVTLITGRVKPADQNRVTPESRRFHRDDPFRHGSLLMD